MTKSVYTPTAGEFITLVELSKLAKIDYSTLFHWQNNFQVLPYFRIEGLKMHRFKKTESLKFLSIFQNLRKKYLKQYDFLKVAKDELLQDPEYREFVELAQRHNQLIEQRILKYKYDG